MSNQYRCALIGGQSLLIQCGQRLLDAGHEVIRVVTSDPQVIEWAASRQLLIADDRGDLCAILTAEPIDYLFSIVNLRLLPATVVDFPSQMAINFHDGPLPGYSGLNVTSWALLNAEKTHGVSWHQITHGIDDGDLLATEKVLIDPQETAFSLNTKCFQAGISSFDSLLDGLNKTALNPQPQPIDKSSQYCALRDRPVSGGVLDWRKPAAEIDTLVRALNYGPGYANAFAVAKVIGPAGVLVVDEIEWSVGDSTAVPGTLLGVDEQGTRVAVVDGSVVLGSCRQLNGEPVTGLEILSWLGGRVGDRLPVLAGDAVTVIDEAYRSLCGQEKYWIDQWQHFEPTPNPFQSTSATDGGVNELRRDYSALLDRNAINGPPGDFLAAGWLLFLGRLADSSDVSVGLTTPAQRGYRAVESAEVHGLFADWLPFNWQIDYAQPAAVALSSWRDAFDRTTRNQSFTGELFARQPTIQSRRQWLTEPLPLMLVQREATDQIGTGAGRTGTAALVLEFCRDSATLLWSTDRRHLPVDLLVGMVERFEVFIGSLAAAVDRPVGELELLTLADERHLARLRRDLDSDAAEIDESCVHQLIEGQAQLTPNAVALIHGGQQWNYRELNSLAAKFAMRLANAGAVPGQRVGILLERSEAMLVAMLATLKSGAAYVPLDPGYPPERLSYMAEDAGLVCLVSSGELVESLGWTGESSQILLLDDLAQLKSDSGEFVCQTVSSEDVAYMIYTSGSTGKPKGVMVEHRNVVNFFSGMDERIYPQEGKVWLALTSISFDISVLELFWTLARGFTVVLYADKVRAEPVQARSSDSRPMNFSLFYWNQVAPGDDPGDYRLLLESAKFGDVNGFSAVWTPERHFGSFGALYPNPAVTSAAVAAVTKNIGIRAGSCVVPLHDPVRVAEEWAMIDRLSGGRVGIAAAAGWMPNDFILQPENFADAKQKMFANLDTVRRLWRGEAIKRMGPNGEVSVRTQPPPIQKELPVWITTAGSVDSFQRAGEMGANLLTHLLGQSIEQVAEKIAVYRAARGHAGHTGNGQVTLLLHTLVGDESQVKELVREPMKRYLASAVSLVKDAAWEFPTYEKLSAETGRTLDEYFDSVADEEMDELLDFAFERYFSSSGLFGSPELLLPRINQLKKIGVDEIGCLIDFGVGDETVLDHLPALNQLRKLANEEAGVAGDEVTVGDDETIAELIVKHGVTHMQCTPSQASMLVEDSASSDALGNLQVMMVGGEALSSDLAGRLEDQVGGKVINMYGPTETTIWSSTYELGSAPAVVPLGNPITATNLYLLDSRQQLVPPGVPAELVIGGAGVVRGYHQREALTAERFIPDPWAASPAGHAAARMYRTGDQVAYSEDGVLTFIGRIDFQVKLRGYRIELGEVEQLLRQHAQVRDAICLVREDQPGDQQLVAYLISNSMAATGQQVVGELRGLVSDYLPEFMCPGHYQFLPRWPLTPNGKVDRRALPEPTRQVSAAVESIIAPAEGLESVIATVWRAVLRRDRVGVNENFFDIGGHSLLVVQVLQKLREQLSQPVQLTDLFRFPTIAGLADHLQGDSQPDAEVTAGRVRGAARRAGLGRRRRPG